MNYIQILLIGCVLLPVLAAPVVYGLKRRSAALCDGIVSVVCLVTLIFTVVILCADPALVKAEHLFLAGISFSSGGMQSIFGVLCAGMFFFGSLANNAYFRGEARTERYRAFMLLAMGGILGVFYAGDFLTLYICFETMSLASWVWVAHTETDAAKKAADTYLAMAMIGGLVMLYGIFLLNHRFGTLSFAELQQIVMNGENTKDLLIPGLCLLVGFGTKVGMFPLHVWLPKSYPAAPAPATALLSSILTKSGIYGIALVIVCLLWKNSTFTLVLLCLGTVTMLFGALLAVFSVDLKRTLACSSMSQIGFILVGAAVLSIGEESALAAGGMMAHAVNHALTKLVLFLVAGVIYKQTHTLDLNKLKGAGRKSLPLMICFLIGGLSLAGVPAFGGYISKTLLHEALVHQIHLQGEMLAGVLELTEKLFLISGGLTAAYMTKLFVKIFVQKPDADTVSVHADRGTLFAIVPAAAALLVMGLAPALTYERIGAFTAASLRSEAFTVSYFVWENLKGAAISLAIGALVYLLFVRGLLTDRKTGDYTHATAVLDLEDDVYRPLLDLLAFVGAFAARICYSVTDGLVRLCDYLLHLGTSRRITPGKDHHFSHYYKGYTKVDPIIQTLQFELMLFGIGVVAIFVYLIVKL